MQLDNKTRIFGEPVMTMELPTAQATREDARIEENRERMGVIFFRKEGESRGLSSGSIVKLNGSKLIRKSEKN